MSRLSLIAGRYARALFTVAERRGEILETLEDLQTLLALVQGDARLGGFLRSPLVPVEHKRRLLRRGLAERAREPVTRFVDLLLRKQRMALLADAVVEYEKRVRSWQGLQEAEVVSAVPLTDDELQRLHGQMQRMTGLTLELSTSVDPGLIGGLTVRIGDRLYDRSVKGLLASLEERLFAVSV
jgi:F-type H+-transporting ATPase subunit delta